MYQKDLTKKKMKMVYIKRMMKIVKIMWLISNLKNILMSE